VAVVPDPADALYSHMPKAAPALVSTEHVAPAAKLGGLIAEIVEEDLSKIHTVDDDALLNAEVAMSELGPLTAEDLALPAAGYGCPACGGSLFEVTDDPVPRYRCRVGHAWSPAALAEEQSQALEGALWMALRGLEERAALSLQMGRRAEERGHGHSAQRFRERHDEAQDAAALLRRLLHRGELGGAGLTDDITEA
jgi:two-component system, chemotaxis family, protein-glutamate methylesterase/glutaminase